VVLVSEVMAQQTQISRVVPAFEAFLKRFPQPEDLAAADLGELLSMWGGLGYQRRAIRLREAALVVVSTGWPRTSAGLRDLPGVGPYTAAAVACFAFGEAVPAVDTNLRRVLSRWTGEPLQARRLDEIAAELLDRGRPATWNQAIMDLGATVCTPRSPDCPACPVSEWCSDPGVYVAPPRQSRYEGSVRQARARILKTLAGHGPLEVAVLAELVDGDADRFDQALAALMGESIVIEVGDRIGLAS